MNVLLPGHSSITIQSFIKVAVHIFLTISTEVPSAQLLYVPFYHKQTYNADTNAHIHSNMRSYLHVHLTQQYIQIKHFGEASPLFKAPQTRVPQSWNAGPSRTTATFLVPCPGPCLERWTSPCPPTRHTPPCHHAILLLHHLSISPEAKFARSHGCEMISLWKTWGKTTRSRTYFMHLFLVWGWFSLQGESWDSSQCLGTAQSWGHV